MNRSFRVVLADSHVAAVAIAVLLLTFLDGAFRAVWPPLSDVLEFLLTAVAIFDIPYFSFSAVEILRLINTTLFLYSSIFSLCAAWVLSKWVYGVGPFRCLSEYRSKLVGREHA